MHATRSPLDGGRWHFQHGPVDLVIAAEGEREAVHAAHENAWARFQTVLPELVSELSALKRPVSTGGPLPHGMVARRMRRPSSRRWPPWPAWWPTNSSASTAATACNVHMSTTTAATSRCISRRGSPGASGCAPICAPLRKMVEKGAALVPSAKKKGTLSTAVDVPLGHNDAAYVRSHFDAVEARVVEAPRAKEIVVAVAVTDSGRPLARIGGMQKHEIKR